MEGRREEKRDVKYGVTTTRREEEREVEEEEKNRE